MNPFFNIPNMGMPVNPMQNMMNVLNQVRQIKQNPQQLACLLKQRGMINDNQVEEIQKMGNNYEQIGHYLMNNGSIPSNIQQYQGQVQQMQNMINN